MRSSTKTERANIIFKIMKEETREAKPLGTWLAIFNKRLSAKYSLRSNKELAHVFKLMPCIMRNNNDNRFEIEKQKKLRSEGPVKIATLFYRLKPIENKK